MVEKRPFGEEELNEVPLKQPRQIEPNDQLVSALEFPSEPVVEICHTEGEGDNCSAKIEPEGDDKLDIGYSTELPVCASKEAETDVLGSFPSSSLFTGSMSEDNIRSEAPFYVMLSPDQNFEHQSRTMVRPGEIYSFVLDHSPQKLIPVGENFQAHIPECLKASSCTERKGEMLTQSLDYDEGRCLILNNLQILGRLGLGEQVARVEMKVPSDVPNNTLWKQKKNLGGLLGPRLLLSWVSTMWVR